MFKISDARKTNKKSCHSKFFLRTDKSSKTGLSFLNLGNFETVFDGTLNFIKPQSVVLATKLLGGAVPTKSVKKTLSPVFTNGPKPRSFSTKPSVPENKDIKVYSMSPRYNLYSFSKSLAKKSIFILSLLSVFFVVEPLNLLFFSPIYELFFNGLMEESYGFEIIDVKIKGL